MKTPDPRAKTPVSPGFVRPQSQALPPVPHSLSPVPPPPGYKSPVTVLKTPDPRAKTPEFVRPQSQALPPVPDHISPIPSPGRSPFVKTGFVPVSGIRKPIPRIPGLTRVTGPVVHVLPDPTKVIVDKKGIDELRRRVVEITRVKDERIRELDRIRVDTGKDNSREMERILKDNNSQLEQLRTELQGRLSSQKDVQAAELERLRAQLQARSDQLVATAAATASDAERRRVQEHNRQLDDKSREIADLKRRLAAGEKDAAAKIAKRESEYALEKAKLDKELAVLEHKMTTAERETQSRIRSERDKAHFEFTTTYVRKLGEAEGKVAGQAQLITSQENQIRELQSRLDRASSSGDTMEVTRLRGQLDNARASMSDLQRTVGRLEGGAAAGDPQLARLQQERDDLQRQVDTGRIDLKQKVAEKDRQIVLAKQQGVSEGQRTARQELNKKLAQQGSDLKAQIERLQAKGTEQQRQLLADMERKLAEGVRQRQAFETKSKGELTQLKSEYEQQVATAKQEALHKGKLEEGLASSRKELADKHAQWVTEKQSLVMKSSDVQSLNDQLTAQLDTQQTAHLKKVASAKKIADSSKNSAVQSAVKAAEDRHATIQKSLSDQVKTKDATISGMTQNLQTVQDKMQQISQAEVKREQERTALLRQYEAQFRKAQAHMYAQVEEINKLKASVSALQKTGQMDKSSFLRHMKTANQKQSELKATLQSTESSMNQIRQATAAQARSEIDKAHSELSAAKMNFERWSTQQNKAQQEKQKLLEEQLAQQSERAQELADTTERMHSMTEHLVHQRDPEVLSKVKQIAAQFPQNTTFQSLLTQANAHMQEEKTAPPELRLPIGYQSVPDAEYEKGPTKRMLSPEPAEGTTYMEITRPVSPTAPAPEDVRGKRARLLDRMQSEFAVKASQVVASKQKADTVTLSVTPATQIQSVQDINKAFNADPNVNIMQVVNQQLGNAVEDDRPKIKAAATRVQAVQQGMQEGNEEVASTIAAIDKLPEGEQQIAYDEAAAEARLKLYDAQKLKQRLEWQKQLETGTELPSELEASMEQETAKREVESRALDKAMQERAHLTTGGSWNLTDEQAAAARARNVVYLAMAVRQIEVVVKAAVPDNIVSQQVVVEQTNIVENAAVQDHRNDSQLPKDKAGPLTKKAIEVVKGPDFSNALQFCQKPWWEASKTMLTSRQVEIINKSKLHGALIQRLVNNQMAKIKNRNKQTLSGTLKKYSLVSQNPDTVTALVQKTELKGLTPAQLQKIIDEYKNIIKGASVSEQQTPNYAAAGRLIQIVRSQLSKVEVAKTSQPSRVSGTRDEPRKKRMRVKASTRTARGLAKKPKKTPKRRKKRAKSAKKTPVVATADVTPPKTALQKWNKHKKAKKMRL